MNIHQAVFVGSTVTMPNNPLHLPTCAVVGRSNVGKSSLINALLGKPIAKASATPGKTRLINQFLVDNSWYMIDLPGYGWARLSHEERAAILNRMERYLLSDQMLGCVLLLLDVRHPLMPIDAQRIIWLEEHSLPYVLVGTKADKKSHSLPCSLKTFPITATKQLFLTSSLNKTSLSKMGCETLLAHIQQQLFPHGVPPLPNHNGRQ